jgi:hypothetical protein
MLKFLPLLSNFLRRQEQQVAQILLCINVYMLDMPFSLSRQFQYAVDMALVHQAPKFDEWTVNVEVLNMYFYHWLLEPNPAKMKMSVFHLSTNGADRRLQIMFDSTQIQQVDHPKYLIATLDRTLTFKTYVKKR